MKHKEERAALAVQADKIKAGIVGASGYTGLELIKMIHRHPHFELAYAATSEGGTDIGSLHPSLEGIIDLEVKKASAKDANGCDLIFLALPHKTAFGFAKDLSCKVVDLSADYRLKLENYEAFYTKHGDAHNMQNFAYGMVEDQKQALKTAQNVAVPGCYPTAALLGLLPFKEMINYSYPLIIDAKSGVSGAGKKCSEKTHFCKDNENSFAYNPLNHRHNVEIAEKLDTAMDNVQFVPQIIPITRGMLSNSYFTVDKDIDAVAHLKEVYKNDRFVRIRKDPVELKNVVGTHFCDIYIDQKGSLVFINAAIDNLLRGASSQAMACANLICGLDEYAGLPEFAHTP